MLYVSHHFLPPLKAAVTERALSTVTVQVPVPLHPPPYQPPKRALFPGVAVRVTTVPLA
jgi:hypothetical protein